ncbi:unnamed protein product [Adineta steineri]|uniref:Zinc finger ZPR1-type domain-containing protein n=1 Tax=Adineta steineri TaxID=433720 RepID=A0A818MBC1_9BILA|nr:unnamed protein product [Adineta steineri]CAF3586390.1 unnamed protein product [Adineta steineri]
MATTESHPAFASLSADDAENQLTEMDSLCMNCHGRGQTRLLLTRIPYYKDVILSSFECDTCHFKNNDIQPAQRVEPLGVLINVHVLNSADLNRQFVKSCYGIVRIKELDFEQSPQGENGVLTTIEGFLSSVIENIQKTIKQIEETLVDTDKNSTDDNKIDKSEFEQQKTKFTEFVARVESLKNLTETFHFEIDDPSGNSFIENPKAPYRDEQLTKKEYRRTPDQNASLGITEEEEAAADAQNHLTSEEIEALKDEVLVFQTNCSSCNAPCDTNMKVTKIPYFKEIIIMATSCDYCGKKSNEVKSGTGIASEGIRYTLAIKDPIDLNRDILVSETSSFAIPELDFELSSSRSIGGKFTTVEGIFTTLKTQLASVIMPFGGGDSTNRGDKNQMCSFIDIMSAVLAGERYVTIVLDDPAGNCYLQNICAPDPDPQLTVEHYKRTDEQNEELGINDMKTENYENS